MSNRILSESESIQKFVDEVIKEENIELHGAKLKVILVSPEIGKLKPANLILANEDLEYFGDCNYLFKISEAHWNAFANDTGSQDLRRILVCHFLAKIYITIGKDGEIKYAKRDSEISGHRWVFNEYGNDYKNDMEIITASIYDMSPEQMEKGLSM